MDNLKNQNLYLCTWLQITLFWQPFSCSTFFSTWTCETPKLQYIYYCTSAYVRTCLIIFLSKPLLFHAVMHYIFESVISTVHSGQLQINLLWYRKLGSLCCCSSSGGLCVCIIHRGNEQCTCSVPCRSCSGYRPTWCETSKICADHSIRRWLH